MFDFVCVIAQHVGGDDLDRVEAGSVRYVDERQAGFGVAPGAHPALDGDGRVARRKAAKNLFYAKCGHGVVDQMEANG